MFPTLNASTQLIIRDFQNSVYQQREAPLTVDGDTGLRFVILAGNLPDVEGLSGRFGQQAEHEDDGVSVRKAIRVDVSAQRETEAVSYYSASSSQKSPTLEEMTEEAETNHVGHFTALAQRVLLGWLLLKPTQRDKFQLLWQNENSILWPFWKLNSSCSFMAKPNDPDFTRSSTSS